MKWVEAVARYAGGVLIMAILPSLASAQWTQISDREILGVANSGTLFARDGFSASLLRSTDGYSWSEVLSDELFDGLRLGPQGSLYTWTANNSAAGQTGLLLRSEDDGQSWHEPCPRFDPTSLNCPFVRYPGVWFDPGGTAYTYGGHSCCTSRWGVFRFDPTLGWVKLYEDAMQGFLAAEDGVLWSHHSLQIIVRSEDGGATWSEHNIPCVGRSGGRLRLIQAVGDRILAWVYPGRDLAHLPAGVVRWRVGGESCEYLLEGRESDAAIAPLPGGGFVADLPSEGMVLLSTNIDATETSMFVSPVGEVEGFYTRGDSLLLVTDAGTHLAAFSLESVAIESLPDPVDQWSLYPNPSRGHVRIGGGVARSLTVFDTMGRAVLRTSMTNAIDLDHLPAGVYWVRLEGDLGSWVGDVVKRD
jgi:Secretion system C-terminal sorting domain